VSLKKLKHFKRGKKKSGTKAKAAITGQSGIADIALAKS